MDEMVFCRFCGAQTPPDSIYCGRCGKEQFIQVQPKRQSVNEFDVWLPILVLIGVIFGASIFGLGGNIWMPWVLLFIAAIYVYKDAKKHELQDPWVYPVFTFLFAIVGLPYYAYKLNELRKEQGLKSVPP